MKVYKINDIKLNSIKVNKKNIKLNQIKINKKNIKLNEKYKIKYKKSKWKDIKLMKINERL